VEKGSVMSVFRYGLVGPNFQPNLLSERAAGPGSCLVFTTCDPPMLVERKGKWLIFHYSSKRAILRWRHRSGSVSWLIVELSVLFVYF